MHFKNWLIDLQYSYLFVSLTNLLFLLLSAAFHTNLAISNFALDYAERRIRVM